MIIFAISHSFPSLIREESICKLLSILFFLPPGEDKTQTTFVDFSVKCASKRKKAGNNGSKYDFFKKLPDSMFCLLFVQRSFPVLSGEIFFGKSTMEHGISNSSQMTFEYF